MSEIFFNGRSLHIEGEYSYFTPSGKSGKEPESPFRGTLESSSGLNRLSFQNNDELLKAILPVISSIAKSNDINFGTIVSNKQGDNFYQFSNLSEEKNKEMIEKFKLLKMLMMI